jgi:RES domain-containing protein
VRLWRIASAAYASFDGEGARRYGSRWTPRGVPAIFASATLSLAALERFVHTDPDLDPDNLVAIAVDLDPDLAIDAVSLTDLPANWRTYPPPVALTAFGGRWIRARQTAVLSVPSVVLPLERNFVLNPAHPDFRRLVVGPAERFVFDPRMWKKRRGS